MIFSEPEIDELPLVMGEVRSALGAVAATLTQYPSDGGPTEIVYHDNDVVDRLALTQLTDVGTRPKHAADAFGWTTCSHSKDCWDVLSFGVQPIPGHAQLIISAFFAQPSLERRRIAEQAYLSRRPFAIGYFRLWQLNRVRVRQTSALKEAMSLSNTGTILINRAYQVTFANAVAEALFAEGTSIRRNGDGTMATTRIAESLRLQVALRHVIDVKSGAKERSAPIMSLRRDNGETLILAVLPASQAGTEPTDVGAIVYIHDPFVKTDKLLLPLCRLYGLSPTESRLTSLLVTGMPLPECARVMRIAEQTARGYLKQLFQKTGTRRQIDLVRLMLISLMHIDPSIEVEAI